MTTQKLLTPLSCQQMEDLFQGTFYKNRRKISSLTKPLVKKIRGTQVWVCSHRGIGPHGFGKTVAEAYASWKSKVDSWC